MVRSLLILGLSISLPTVAHGQASGPDVRSLAAGANLRIVYPCQGNDQPLCRAIEARFAGLVGDSIEVRRPGESAPERIPLGLRTRIEVLDGTHANVGPGLLLGLVAGIGVGYAASQSCQSGEDRGLCQALTYAVSVPVGLLIGAMIGAATRSDRWRDVLVPDHPALQLGAGPRGFTVGVRFKL